MSDALSRIFALPGSATRFVQLDVFGLLKKHHGSEIHLYCNNKQDIRFYETYRESGVIDSVNQVCTLYQSIGAQDLDHGAVLERARVHEARLGCTYNHLAVSDRHLGRGYALGGFRHPRSRYSTKTSYVQMLHAYNETLDYWEAEIAKHSPTLFISGGKIPATVARAHGVPYRFMAGARYKNYYYWAENEYFSAPNLEAAFTSTSKANSKDIESPYHDHLVNRAKFLKSRGLFELSHVLAMTAARRGYWWLRGYEKGRGYYMMDELALHIRRWRDTRRLTGPGMCRLRELAGQPFVYYPLHTEPEMALQTLSPEYFYQLSCIAALSRDLPAGVILAVKETLAAMGRRPRDFYAQIKEFKNVRLLDTRELGLEVVRAATAIATITGTGGFEAAVMGKPVISFGRHNLYNFLPHVRLKTDEARLKGDLAWALSPEFNHVGAQADGSRFLSSIIATSFDMGDYTTSDGKNYDQSGVQRAYENLLSSLSAWEETGHRKGAAQ
ncbi:MAG: hypothetical protein CMM54_08895 [Rhodospirillaceae bacterium]|nr:hypothetical protein [Rhodospirillaceae bacterium]|tara:strand:- start:2762 stop:4255 length:1494 start_codon:yes stop_codon:yes gene_type:complete